MLAICKILILRTIRNLRRSTKSGVNDVLLNDVHEWRDSASNLKKSLATRLRMRRFGGGGNNAIIMQRAVLCRVCADRPARDIISRQYFNGKLELERGVRDPPGGIRVSRVIKYTRN